MVRTRLVYLTWTTSPCGHARQRPHTRGPATLISHVFTMSDRIVRLDGREQDDPVLDGQIEACGTKEWWSVSGSNRRPPACKAGALPAELTPRLFPRPPAADMRSAPALGRLGASFGARHPTARGAARSVRPPKADNPEELGGSRWTRTIDLTLIRRVL